MLPALNNDSLEAYVTWMFAIVLSVCRGVPEAFHIFLVAPDSCESFMHPTKAGPVDPTGEVRHATSLFATYFFQCLVIVEPC